MGGAPGTEEEKQELVRERLAWEPSPWVDAGFHGARVTLKKAFSFAGDPTARLPCLVLQLYLAPGATWGVVMENIKS